MLPILLDAWFEDRNPLAPAWWEHSHREVRGSPSRKNPSLDVTRNHRARSLSEIKTPDHRREKKTSIAVTRKHRARSLSEIQTRIARRLAADNARG